MTSSTQKNSFGEEEGGCKREAFTTPPDTGVVLVGSTSITLETLLPSNCQRISICTDY